jgi:hypothetical protein
VQSQVDVKTEVHLHPPNVYLAPSVKVDVCDSKDVGISFCAQTPFASELTHE